MDWFRNWKIRTKILSLVVLMAVFIVAVGFTGYYYNYKAKIEMTSLYSDSLMSVEYLNDARAQSKASESAFYHYLLVQDKVTQQKLRAEMETTSGNFDKSYKSYRELASASYEKERLAEIDKELAAYRTERQKAVDIANQGDSKGAYEYFKNNAEAHLDTINDCFDKLTDFTVKEADASNTQNEANNTKANTIIISISIIATILGVLLGYLIANLIANSIKTVLASVEKVATGDLSAADIVVKSHDEAGHLAESFNVMKEQLDELVKRVTKSSEQVAASSEELSAITEGNTEATNHVAQAIESVAEGAQKQTTAIDETLSAIQQISASNQEVAANSSEITDYMAKTLTTTHAGQEALNRVIQQMNSISEGNDAVQRRIAELSASSEEISGIVQFITGIAEQTNLLALNAAIEAARAGEQGRGFAVVAEEVRKLAEQSREATTKISALIHQNNSHINLAVTAMEEEVNNVKEGMEVVNIAGQSFTEIAQLIENVSAQMEEVSATFEQIASGGQQILTSVEKIDTTSKETTSHAETVSAGVQEQTASMEQIASAAQSLAAMASELQEVVGKFTV
ncbi:methyl-accepting chemotaxis protein [Desulfitobacterium sp. Sab5]|uniref:methyl-accepting chemotaxis protein n=1 Tax=Desulfitobacterium nosdiversum TaxID=3375356 RepID=UPI003CE75A3D